MQRRHFNRVADPGCLSRIPDPTFSHPGSRIRIFFYPGSTSKNLSILIKKLFLSSRKYDPSCSSRMRILIFYPSRIPGPGSRGQKGTGSRIRIQHCILTVFYWYWLRAKWYIPETEYAMNTFMFTYTELALMRVAICWECAEWGLGLYKVCVDGMIVTAAMSKKTKKSDLHLTGRNRKLWKIKRFNIWDVLHAVDI